MSTNKYVFDTAEAESNAQQQEFDSLLMLQDDGYHQELSRLKSKIEWLNTEVQDIEINRSEDDHAFWLCLDTTVISDVADLVDKAQQALCDLNNSIQDVRLIQKEK